VLLDADRNMPSMLKAREQMLTHLGGGEKKGKTMKRYFSDFSTAPTSVRRKLVFTNSWELT